MKKTDKDIDIKEILEEIEKEEKRTTKLEKALLENVKEGK